MTDFSMNVTEMESQMSQLRGQCNTLFSLKARVSSEIVKLRCTPNSVALSIRQRLGYESSRISKEINNIYTICVAGGRIVSAVRKADSDAKYNLETNLKQQIQEILRGGIVNIVTAITTAVKGLLELYQRAVKTIADWFNRMRSDYIDDIYKKDIDDIAKNAKEPYKSIYEKYKDRYKIGNARGDDTGYFDPNNNTINVDVPNEPGNVKGPYNTWFHESGHGIDYNYNDDGQFYSVTYRDASGRSLQDVIYQDVRTNISKTVSEYSSDPDTIQRITDYMTNPGSRGDISLSGREKAILNYVKDDYSALLGGEVNSSPSDIYGGVTDNLVHGNWGHWDADYWYNANGSATNNQSVELFAEYYAAAMTGDTAAMDAIRQYFPNASEFLDGMVESMR